MSLPRSLARAGAALALLPVAAAAQTAAKPAAAPRAFTPADWYKLTTVSAPALSPDWQRVAFTVTTLRVPGTAGVPPSSSIMYRAAS